MNTISNGAVRIEEEVDKARLSAGRAMIFIARPSAEQASKEIEELGESVKKITRQYATNSPLRRRVDESAKTIDRFVSQGKWEKVLENLVDFLVKLEQFEAFAKEREAVNR